MPTKALAVMAVASITFGCSSTEPGHIYPMSIKGNVPPGGWGDSGPQDSAPDSGSLPDSGTAPDSGVVPDAGSTPDSGTEAVPEWVCDMIPATPSTPMAYECGVLNDPQCTPNQGPFCVGDPDVPGMAGPVLLFPTTTCDPATDAATQCSGQVNESCVYNYIYMGCVHEATFLPCSPCVLPDGG